MTRVAIVTGAARGVGAAVMATLARQGARVAAADVQFEELTRATAREAHRLGGAAQSGRASTVGGYAGGDPNLTARVRDD